MVFAELVFFADQIDRQLTDGVFRMGDEVPFAAKMLLGGDVLAGLFQYLGIKGVLQGDVVSLQLFFDVGGYPVLYRFLSLLFGCGE